MASQPPDPQDRLTLERSHAMSALLLELATMPSRSESWERVLRAGETVGRFELVREIGRGGFGIVYEARDRELGRSVAFKAVRPGRGVEVGAREILLREAESIAQLSHPNLVTLHDVGRCEQGPYLVLELLRGMTLAERLRIGPLPVAEALRVGIDVACGLAHAHAAGVTHRDLKPSNVFLCEGGHAKVLDFGMAHAFGRPRTLGGTPAYMAPEQWREGPEDERTDVFALGVMVYQMLRGEVPFPEGGRSLEEGQRPALEVPECPALGGLVARMLERDPADRPRDAAEVLSALVAFRDALRTGEDTTARYALPPGPRRPSWPVLAAAAVVLVAAMGLWLSFGPWRSGQAERPSVAVLPFAVLSTNPDDPSLSAGIHSEVITRLTQIGGIRVIARSSVQGYAPGNRDLKAIARQLGVKAVVEGEVQRDGDRLRIQAHLVDPMTGELRWADRFDRRADDLFALQSEVALEVAGVLGARLTASERERVGRPPTHDALAHQLYLRALYFWGRSSEDADRGRSQELLTAAVARDPRFALAHAWLAVLDTELANSGRGQYPFDPMCEEAGRHASRALELDPGLPEAHGALAEVRWACADDNPGALAEYEVEARGAPGDAVARVNVGFTRMAMGQWSAGAEDLRAAMSLDPRSYFVAMLVAERMIQVRRFDDAEQACRRAQELSPGDLRAPTTCALIPFWRSGDLGPARAALDAAVQQWGTSGAAATAAIDLLYLLPERTLALSAAGRIPDPVSERDPFVPRALLTGVAHLALGQLGEAQADLHSVVGPLESAVAELRRHEDRESLAVELLWLARAHAGVGRGEEAMGEAREALALIHDVPGRTFAQVDAAEVAVAAGHREEAMELLAGALDSPGGTITVPSLHSQPGLFPLRGYPPFEALAAPQLAGR